MNNKVCAVRCDDNSIGYIGSTIHKHLDYSKPLKEQLQKIMNVFKDKKTIVGIGYASDNHKIVWESVSE